MGDQPWGEPGDTALALTLQVLSGERAGETFPLTGHATFLNDQKVDRTDLRAGDRIRASAVDRS